MKFLSQDAEWYCLCMRALPYVVKECLQERPNITSFQEDMAGSHNEKLQVRHALFEQREPIQSGVEI